MVPFEQNGELAKVFWREFLFHKGQLRKEIDQQSETILGALAQRIGMAQIKKEIDARIDPGVAALQLYAIYHATLAFHLAGCLPGKSPSATLEALLQSAWIGLAPRGEWQD
jgi:hypothetical protein